MEVEEKTEKRNYGKMGCFVALLILVVIIVLVATGLINLPWEY